MKTIMMDLKTRFRNTYQYLHVTEIKEFVSSYIANPDKSATGDRNIVDMLNYLYRVGLTIDIIRVTELTEFVKMIIRETIGIVQRVASDLHSKLLNIECVPVHKRSPVMDLPQERFNQTPIADSPSETMSMDAPQRLSYDIKKRKESDALRAGESSSYHPKSLQAKKQKTNTPKDSNDTNERKEGVAIRTGESSSYHPKSKKEKRKTSKDLNDTTRRKEGDALTPYESDSYNPEFINFIKHNYETDQDSDDTSLHAERNGLLIYGSNSYDAQLLNAIVPKKEPAQDSYDSNTHEERDGLLTYGSNSYDAELLNGIVPKKEPAQDSYDTNTHEERDGLLAYVVRKNEPAQNSYDTNTHEEGDAPINYECSSFNPELLPFIRPKNKTAQDPNDTNKHEEPTTPDCCFDLDYCESINDIKETVSNDELENRLGVETVENVINVGSCIYQAVFDSMINFYNTFEEE